MGNERVSKICSSVAMRRSPQIDVLLGSLQLDVGRWTLDVERWTLSVLFMNGEHRGGASLELVE